MASKTQRGESRLKCQIKSSLHLVQRFIRPALSQPRPVQLPQPPLGCLRPSDFSVRRSHPCSLLAFLLLLRNELSFGPSWSNCAHQKCNRTDKIRTALKQIKFAEGKADFEMAADCVPSGCLPFEAESRHSDWNQERQRVCHHRNQAVLLLLLWFFAGAGWVQGCLREVRDFKLCDCGAGDDDVPMLQVWLLGQHLWVGSPESRAIDQQLLLAETRNNSGMPENDLIFHRLASSANRFAFRRESFSKSQ